ncbi:hypothetical protein ACLOJK_030263 [Asimina triloba]
MTFTYPAKYSFPATRAGAERGRERGRERESEVSRRPVRVGAEVVAEAGEGEIGEVDEEGGEGKREGEIGEVDEEGGEGKREGEGEEEGGGAEASRSPVPFCLCFVVLEMGISEGLDGGGAVVDCSVGTIVWVRRRNGSWWPGRILGPNELAASNIMSPRSGTPVKLLGREDASVTGLSSLNNPGTRLLTILVLLFSDWYNLEKSKRVKAFRCGEFDDCIRKAEASQGMPIKKREKYARREDAIIHALELERQHRERQPQKVGTASNYLSNKMPCTLKELSSYTPENHGGMEGARNYYKSMNFKSQLLSKKPDSFLDEERHVSLDTQKGNLGKIPNMEDDKSEAIPRMRGLQDFGLHIASSKRKLSASAAYDSSHKPLRIENHTHSFPNGEHTVGNTNHVSSVKNSSSFKRRRPLGGVTDEFFAKRRDRRRPLVQVLKSSAKMPMCQPLQVNGDAVPNSTLGEGDQGSRTFRAKRSKCVYLSADSSNYLDHTKSPSDHLQVLPSHIAADNCIQHPGSLTEENSSGFVEAEESDSTETEYLDTDMEEQVTAVSGDIVSSREKSCAIQFVAILFFEISMWEIGLYYIWMGDCWRLGSIHSVVEECYYKPLELDVQDGTAIGAGPMFSGLV